MRESHAREPTRVLPYDLAFSDPSYEERHFPAMRAEVRQRNIDATAMQQFLQLHNVGVILRTVLVDSEQTAVSQFGPLLFQAYHFWQHGWPVYELDESLFRALVGEPGAVGAWSWQAPAPAGYLQMPRHLLWARIDERATPEAVDGLFWTMAGPHPESWRYERIEVLLVLGLVSGRPGFSIAQVSGAPDAEPGGHWGDAQMRTEGTDFGNMLPGGELQRLHALQTAGEVLKLVSRAFWYHAQHASALQRHSRAVPRQRPDAEHDG
jgi:hypothetical protein